MCPIGGKLWDGVSRGMTGQLVCHCLLVETDNSGLVLVDTGFGSRDVEDPYERLSPLFIHTNRIQFDHRYTALEQVRLQGFSPRDVRHIVLTHLDFDHAEDRRGMIQSRRYRPEQWDEVRNWRFYNPGGEGWFGFDAVRDLDGLPPEILMIPLPGHTAGHAGIAISTPDGWLLNAGDAYFHRHEMDPEPHCTPGLAAYQRLMEMDRPTRLHNQERLRELANDGRSDVRIFCSHDPVELEALSRLSTGWRPLSPGSGSRVRAQ
jgi:glyoxylase-like metal-dependent hydrolase (beta-lactamase superfamily II)